MEDTAKAIDDIQRVLIERRIAEASKNIESFKKRELHLLVSREVVSVLQDAYYWLGVATGEYSVPGSLFTRLEEILKANDAETKGP